MHTHIIPEKLPRFAEKFGYGDFIYLDHHRKGYARMMKGNTFFREIKENCWNPSLRIEEYKQFNTQVQVICTIPVMFSYWAKPKDTLELSQFLNDDIAQTVNDNPRNYVGLGTVPMQHADFAVQELERLKSIGLKGIQIGSNINDLNLNEEQFYPIWKACEELDLAVMVHPWNMMGMKHMAKYWLPWLVGMPAETSRAICSMIFGGIFEKFPKIRVNFSHAGGSFIGTIGRVEHGYNCRPDLVAIDNPKNPREYLGDFWIDCITHDLKTLKFVIDHVGSEKVCLGSDYPFPLGDLDIGKFIEESDLDHHTIENIFSKSSLDWLNMKAEDFA